MRILSNYEKRNVVGGCGGADGNGGSSGNEGNGGECTSGNGSAGRR